MNEESCDTVRGNKGIQYPEMLRPPDLTLIRMTLLDIREVTSYQTKPDPILKQDQAYNIICL